MVSNGEVWEELMLNKTVAGEDMVNYASAGPGWRHQTSGACSSIIPHRSQTQVIFGLKLICGAHSQLLRLTELSRSQNNNSSISLAEEHLQIFCRDGILVPTPTRTSAINTVYTKQKKSIFNLSVKQIVLSQSHTIGWVNVAVKLRHCVDTMGTSVLDLDAWSAISCGLEKYLPSIESCFKKLDLEVSNGVRLLGSLHILNLMNRYSRLWFERWLSSASSGPIKRGKHLVVNWMSVSL